MAAGGEIATLGVEAMTRARYTYTIAASATAFTATAAGNLDDDAAIDTWTIDDAGVLTNTINDVSAT